MTESQLNKIAAWFTGFVATFRGESPAEQRNYDLKIVHTHQVRANIERLAASLDLAAEERTLAAAIALCHDVGRFPQYRRYSTFNDAASTNHATLAISTLKAEGVLDALAAEERSVLLQVVALHNVFTLPADLDPVVRRFTLLIRDADKLDIWRIVIEHCSAGPEERASAVSSCRIPASVRRGLWRRLWLDGCRIASCWRPSMTSNCCNSRGLTT